MIIIPLLMSAIATWQDLRFVRNYGRYFDPAVQIMPNKSPPCALVARDVAWICEGVAEREQAAAALANINGHQQFLVKEYYAAWNVEAFGLNLIRTSGFSCSDYIAGKNGAVWFKEFCVDPTAQPGEDIKNYDGTLEQFINDRIVRNYCNNSVFTHDRFYGDLINSNEVIAVYYNLKNSTRFASRNLNVQTSGKRTDVVRGTRNMGETAPFSWSKYGGYETYDKTKDDWTWGDRKVTYNLEDIYIPNVPRGSHVSVYIAASFATSAHIYSKEGYEMYTGPEYNGVFILFEAEKDIPVYGQEAVSDCLFTSSDFHRGAFDEYVDRLKSYMDRVDVETKMGTPADKEVYGQGTDYIICPCAMIDLWCTDYKVVVTIDLGDHTKWWD